MEIPEAEAEYLRAALTAAQAVSDYLRWMEQVAEQLAPERSTRLAEETQRQHGERLHTAAETFRRCTAPEELSGFGDRLRAGIGDAVESCDLFTSSPLVPPIARIPTILGALHHLAQAQEQLYPLRQALPPFNQHWAVPGMVVTDAPARRSSEETPGTGVVHVSAGGHHGGFSLYVPETYADDRTWPVIVALHGGSGNGRDFLWTWLREAKSFGYLLVAPTAVGATWSDVEDRGLLEILAWLGARYRVDDGRVLLTGLSDGATFAVLYGLAHPDVYRALAPLCGVLHPANGPLGNMQRARDVPIYLVHGALDFLFPVHLAHFTRDTLRGAGAALEYREVPELSHTYPRSENPRILRWFGNLPPRLR